ncbi:hypothetical protein BDU57DRAFT_532078 [Ampelomyces quisqualis]|uniref:Uncharacterized protein n=1 Tax=Ampelomyces quisqualis TaxID=50730 RepID=A0A6A5QFS2_AMPQU|nr:hypothetical protein BDU57DRAFT_532078 [Ampelomyces quisqualis]
MKPREDLHNLHILPLVSRPNDQLHLSQARELVQKRQTLLRRLQINRQHVLIYWLSSKPHGIPRRGDALDHVFGQQHHQPLDTPDIDLENLYQVPHKAELGTDLEGGVAEGGGFEETLAIVDAVVVVSEECAIAVAKAHADDAIGLNLGIEPAGTEEFGEKAEEEGDEGVTLETECRISFDRA